MAVLYSPCADCPFRSDRPAFLTRARAREIVRAMKRDQHFDCHKTVDYNTDDGEGGSTNKSRICAGFAMMCETEGLPTQMMRIAGRIGLYNPEKMKMDAPTHKTAKAFIAAQEP